MHVECKRMFLKLAEKIITVLELRKGTGLSTCTFTRFRINDPVTINVLLKIAEYLDCRIEDLCGFIKVDSGKRATL